MLRLTIFLAVVAVCVSRPCENRLCRFLKNSGRRIQIQGNPFGTGNITDSFVSKRQTTVDASVSTGPDGPSGSIGVDHSTGSGSVGGHVSTGPQGTSVGASGSHTVDHADGSKTSVSGSVDHSSQSGTSGSISVSHSFPGK